MMKMLLSAKTVLRSVLIWKHGSMFQPVSEGRGFGGPLCKADLRLVTVLLVFSPRSLH
jgi:hypothetical protein